MRIPIFHIAKLLLSSENLIITGSICICYRTPAIRKRIIHIRLCNIPHNSTESDRQSLKFHTRSFSRAHCHDCSGSSPASLRSRNSEGVKPVKFLKMVEKWGCEVKPTL